MSTDAATSLPNKTSAATVVSAPPLPDDPLVLKRMIVELLATLQQTQRNNEQLRQRLDQLLRRLYGPRAEKFDPNQPFFFADAPNAPAPPDATLPPAAAANGAAAKKNGHGRRRLPDDLPRVPCVHDLSETERLCPDCGGARIKIGEEASEQLDYVPASLFVRQHVRSTYACRQCEGQLVTASLPAQPIAKGLPGPGLLAQIITSKFGDYLPLYRLERIFARHGLELPRSTTCDWMAACAALLGPLYDLMVERVRQSRVLHTDDTVLPVQDATRERTRQGRLWVYVGDRDHACTVFDYTPNHTRDGPQQWLAGFQGYLQADAFGGYDGIYLASGGTIVEAACNAHARRKFYEARTTEPARAHAALAWYRQLYAIEKEAAAQIEAEALDAARADALRLRWRQEQALPLWTDFHAWLVQQRREVLPKSPFGQAIRYALGNWEALVRHTQQGFLAIDNNVAEREMKCVAIGRKNFLFVGSDQGGRTAAVLFSMIASCRRHQLDPFVYLRDALDRLAPGALSPEQLAALLPGHWQAPPNPSPAPPSKAR
jgi:transposase